MLLFACFVTVCISLVMGVLWGTWLSASRSMRSFDANMFLAIGKVMIANLTVPMRILMPATLMSLAGLTVMLGLQHAGLAFALASTASVAMAGVVVVTLLVNVPIDLKVRQWTIHHLPPDWSAVRDRWAIFHTVRVGFAMLAFIVALAMVVAIASAV